MVPINTATNETPPISDEFLREKYGLTEEYKNKCPESFEKVLSLVRATEETFQGTIELGQSLREYSNSEEALREDNKILLAQQKEAIKSHEERMEALERLAKSSSELRAMTSNLENIVSICANRIFHPIRNGFYFLTGHREPAEVLPGEDPLAISHTDPTNQTSGNVKKTCRFAHVFYGFGRVILFACKRAEKLVIFICKTLINLISKSTLWFCPK